MLCGIGIPLITALGANVLLCRKKKMSAVDLQKRAEVQRDTKLAQTLLILTVLFYLTWLPFTVVAITCDFGLCRYVTVRVYYLTKLLQHTNSFANPIIYALRIPVFRATLKKCLCNRKRKPRNVRAQVSKKDEL